MSMNKAIHQVIMHEQIGGNKQAPPQPIKPVKMPEAPRPAGSPPKRITGVNAPPPKRPIPFPFPGDTTKEIQPKPIRPGTGSQPRPIPASGGAEVTPPEGLPESMKAFWKQRLGNQIIERKQLGVVAKVIKKVLPYVGLEGMGDGMMPQTIDPFGLIPDPFVGPGNSYPYDEMNPNGYPYNDQGRPEMPAGTQGTGQWAGPNVPSGGGVAV